MLVPAILSFSKILQWPCICCASLIETKPIHPRAIIYPYRVHKCNIIHFFSPVHFCSYIYSPICGLYFYAFLQYSRKWLFKHQCRSPINTINWCYHVHTYTKLNAKQYKPKANRVKSQSEQFTSNHYTQHAKR